MVSVRVTRSADGCLSELVMDGHVSSANGPRGANLVCAAVTGIVRSCADVIAAADGISATGSAGREGSLHVTVRTVVDQKREWLRGVTDVLTAGVRRMAEEAPGEVELHEGQDARFPHQ